MKIIGLWDRLNYLVPEPNCETRGDEYDSVAWSDARPMPTLSQTQSVTDRNLRVGQEDESTDRKLLSKINRLMVNEIIALDDRIRVLEGLPPVVRLDYMNQLKSKYRAL